MGEKLLDFGAASLQYLSRLTCAVAMLRDGQETAQFAEKLSEPGGLRQLATLSCRYLTVGIWMGTARAPEECMSIEEQPDPTAKAQENTKTPQQ